MTHTLQTLAELFRKSAAGGRGAARDFTIDYEKFLRAANAADGDEREFAERDLLSGERESKGLLSIDRAPRSGIPTRIRLARDGGEAWLFTCLGTATPAGQREALAAFFRQAATWKVPEKWSKSWQQWHRSLAARALGGESIQPFHRGDSAGNADFVRTLAGVLNWQGESLIRYASAVICGDSKRLQALESRLLAALVEITGATSLDSFGILHKPRTVMFHGPLALHYANRIVDFTVLPGVVSLSETNLTEATKVTTTTQGCLTVENEDVFLELAKRNPGVLLVHTSFPGSAVRRLFGLLDPAIECHHFGDSDPAGFDILRDLREKTGRFIRPMFMDPRPGPGHPPLSPMEIQTLQRLIESPLLADLHPVLQDYLAAGTKGEFEQESVPIALVLEAIRRF
jgi:hypothetical protein